MNHQAVSGAISVTWKRKNMLLTHLDAGARVWNFSLQLLRQCSRCERTVGSSLSRCFHLVLSKVELGRDQDVGEFKTILRLVTIADRNRLSSGNLDDLWEQERGQDC